MVFHFIEMVGLTGRLWEPDVLYGQSKPITGDRKGFKMPFSGTGTDMSIKLHSGQRRALMWKIESVSPAKYIYRLLFFCQLRCCLDGVHV